MIWNWIYDDLWRWRDEKNERTVLWQELTGGLGLIRTDPDAAREKFEAGRVLAAQWGEKWWEMLFEHWKLQSLLDHAHGAQALDLAARCAVEVRKPLYASFPQRVCLHEDLITAYCGLDPMGHAPLIRDALDYMDGEIVPGYECRLCHYGLVAQFLTETGAPEAIEAAWRYVQAAEESHEDHYRIYAAARLCVTLLERDPAAARREIGEIARVGEEVATRRENPQLLAELGMWRALAARWAGDDEAPRLYRNALARQKRLKTPRTEFFIPTLAFHQAAGDTQKALEIVMWELEELEDRGQTHRETQQRTLQCQFLSELNRPFAAELQKAREVAQKLKNPAPWLEKLAALEAS